LLEFLANQGWRILFHDCECAHVQIDVIARDPNGILTIVEVKSQTTSGMAYLPRRQQRRLERAASVLAQWEPIEIVLALVEDDKIVLVPVS
jgi:Holliday junction resolvase-like predicted endonuclease